VSVAIATSFLSSPPAKRGERIKVRGVSIAGEVSKISLFLATAPSPSYEYVSVSEASFAGNLTK
jgi:hypothetical protein